MNNLPPRDQLFDIIFPNQHTAKAIRVKQDADPEVIKTALGFNEIYPIIFITGGASAMSDRDKQLTQSIIESIAEFAEEQETVIIDGGTESGIMKMIGDTRGNQGYKFPLIGVSPMGKVSYPGYGNPNEEAFLEDSHSHFVLVEGETWGDESSMIVNLTHAISGHREKPAVGILINGGKIAMHEVYLATTTQNKLPMIVLDGSGRAADEISTAFRTGKTAQDILQAIIAGGDIQLVGTIEGPEAVRKKLAKKFEPKST